MRVTRDDSDLESSSSDAAAKLRALPGFTYGIWLLLSLPFAWLLYQYLNEEIYYGGFVHDTGRYAVWLLLFTMAIAPLRLTFARSQWTRLLMQLRRSFGVAVFGYAAAHLIAYIIKSETLDRIVEEAAEAQLWTGWLAMVIFFVLALTSSDWFVRRLGRNWKSLHRFVHVAAILTFAHWILTAFDPTTAYWHAALLLLLEGWRLSMTYIPRRASYVLR